MLSYRNIFSKIPSVIGMIHVKGLPGSPNFQSSIEKIIEDACEEAELYKRTNVDGVLVENMHDIPYILEKDSGPELTAMMTKVCSEVRKIIPKDIPIGVQILAGNNKAALATAQASGLNFIRCEGFIFSHIADEGLFAYAQAGPLLRYRKQISAENILIFTDIKKKHSSHAITDDLNIEEVAKAASFFQSDGLILTGTTTGDPVNPEELQSVKKCVDLPILIGSGVNINNVNKFIQADALIIGSHFKKDDRWQNPIDENKVYKFIEKVQKIQK